MHILVREQIAEIDAQQWNALLSDNNPFMRHEFLHGLEACGCVTEQRGWVPQHIAMYTDESCTALVAAMPCYRKEHSYGEYIFDWAWADAHHRHGVDYYPKLCNAAPFTPATGPRWLISDAVDYQATTDALLNKALEMVEDQSLSSFHSLFCTAEQAELAVRHGFSKRSSSQFHWHNNDYSSFADFLAELTSKKRKNIKRERRRVRESEIEYVWLTGSELNQQHARQMYQFYARTIRYYGAQSYLNLPFFEYLVEQFAEQTLILFARFNNQIIAGGLYFRSDTALYGRYWGALDNFHSIHFETCYYQPIEWCIANGVALFEAGAQGEHKLARGLEPTTVYSAHWIADERFRHAIDDFLVHEEQHIERYQTAMRSHSAFKVEV